MLFLLQLSHDATNITFLIKTVGINFLPYEKRLKILVFMAITIRARPFQPFLKPFLNRRLHRHLT